MSGDDAIRVLTIVGARPQFIKAAMVSRQLATVDDIDEVLLHTGQHYDQNMSHVFFDELGIPKPGFQLEVGSGSHGAQTGRMLEGIESAIQASNPDWVLVYGDTNSTLAGALAAVKLHVPVAHVEAGVRSFNKRMPEEINRIATDHVSQALLPPTHHAVKLLRSEGVPEHRIHLVGDITCDAAIHFAGIAQDKSDILERLELRSSKYAIVTVHRAENVREPHLLRTLVEAIHKLSQTMPVVWPVHPGTRKLADEQGLFEDVPDSLHLLPPIGFLDSLCLQSQATLLATDSGGMQKEAFVLGVPCLTLREETEWPETVNNRWNRLVRQNEFAELPEIASDWLKTPRQHQKIEFFGDERAAERIVEVFRHYRPQDPSTLFLESEPVA